MAGNQVTLTFAGDEKPLTSSFDRVGDSSKHMSDKVGDSAGGFDRAGEAADGAEGKFMGFHDVLDGVKGAIDTLKDKDASLTDKLIGLGQAGADVAGGLASFLIPVLGKAKTAIMGMNFAFLSSPIFWIIAAIVILIGIIVLIAVKTDWFQKAWSASWKWIKGAAMDTWNWLKQLPGWIGTAFAKVAGFISAPYKAAFNLIADAWNNTIGRLHFTIPGWIPGIGGNSISVPNLPHWHSGGVVPGVPGSEQLAVLQAGEKVSPATSGGGDTVHVVVKIDRDTLLDIIAKGNRRGGPKVA